MNTKTTSSRTAQRLNWQSSRSRQPRRRSCSGNRTPVGTFEFLEKRELLATGMVPGRLQVEWVEFLNGDGTIVRFASPAGDHSTPLLDPAIDRIRVKFNKPVSSPTVDSSDLRIEAANSGSDPLRVTDVRVGILTGRRDHFAGHGAEPNEVAAAG